jgi:hypothetical protein
MRPIVYYVEFVVPYAEKYGRCVCVEEGIPRRGVVVDMARLLCRNVLAGQFPVALLQMPYRIEVRPGTRFVLF